MGQEEPEWWDAGAEEDRSRSWLEIFSFLKPHLFHAVESTNSKIEEKTVETHPILVKWQARLKREPKNEALRIAMEEYIDDNHLNRSDWL